MSFINELNRRNVLRAGLAYLAVAWLLIQIADTVFPLFGLPDAAARVVVQVFAIGFIPALIFAWVFEITPEGLKRDADVDRSDARMTGKKADRAIMLVMALTNEGTKYEVAKVNSWTGDADAAFEVLERAYEEDGGDAGQIAHEPLFQKLHDDPRWISFLEKTGYAPEQLAALPFNITIPE